MNIHYKDINKSKPSELDDFNFHLGEIRASLQLVRTELQHIMSAFGIEMFYLLRYSCCGKKNCNYEAKVSNINKN